VPLDNLVGLDGFLNKEVSKKIDGAFLSIHRALLSTDRKFKFYVLYASNVELIGFDYITVGYVPDIIRARLGAISRGDYFQRILNEVKLNDQALDDYEGEHIFSVDISLSKFLAEQITQRIRKKFTEDDKLKQYFEVDSADWDVSEKDFIFDMVLVKRQDTIPADLDVKEIMLEITAYVFKNYNFKDYKGVKLFNPLGEDFSYFNKGQIETFFKE